MATVAATPTSSRRVEGVAAHGHTDIAASPVAAALTSSSRVETLTGHGHVDTEASPLTFTEFVEYQRYVSTPKS